MEKNMLKKLFLIFLLSLSIGACATTQSTLQKKMSIGGVPQFNEYISPITIPIQPMYSPAVINFKQEIATNFDVTENSSTKSMHSYVDIAGKYEIKKLGDMLTWDFVINKMTANGKKLSPNLALFEARLLTDEFGKIQEIETTSPALSSSLDQEELAESVDAMKETLKQFSCSLPKNPVRSGDTLMKIDNSNFLAMFSDDEGSVDMEGDLEQIIKGWGYFNEKKVIVTSVDKVINFKVDDFDLQLKFNGYCLLDPETFQVVDGYHSIVIISGQGDIKVSGKMLIHTSATRL